MLAQHASFQEQEQVLLSVRDNHETFVHAANQTGKTLIAAIIAIWFFVSRTPARVIISSSNETQLESVLWSEICQLIRSAAFADARVESRKSIRRGRASRPRTEPILGRWSVALVSGGRALRERASIGRPATLGDRKVTPRPESRSDDYVVAGSLDACPLRWRRERRRPALGWPGRSRSIFFSRRGLTRVIYFDRFSLLNDTSSSRR